MSMRRYNRRTLARINAVRQDLDELVKQVEEERTHYTLGTIEAWLAGMKAGLKYLLHEKTNRDI